MSDSHSTHLISATPAERRSGLVFFAMLALVLLAVAFPEMAPQGLLGILWTGAGLLMVLLPPEVRVPKSWYWLAGGFVLFSLVGFLPRDWFHISVWRLDLERLGLKTGGQTFLQPSIAAEVMVGFTATALTCIFLLGHRINSRYHHRLTLGFALGVGIWTIAALVMQPAGGTFGFFPNRNHTATLLVMGTFAALGSLSHSILRRAVVKIALSALPLIVCLYAVSAVSVSRAGIVLVLAGFVIWVLLIGVRQLKGNVGKALLLLLVAGGGFFLIIDSTAKRRLSETVGQEFPVEAGSATTPENPFAAREKSQAEVPMDGRLAIYKDTLEMIRHESWTGVGPGQFSMVFPQYRNATNADNNARCLHPESDWLFMVAETGWPATLCLAGGLIAVFYSSVKQSKLGESRSLKTSTIVAALILCLHGLFDVPGHRVGLALAGALLLAASFRTPMSRREGGVRELSRFSKNCWRGLGLVLVVPGVVLLYAQISDRPVLNSVRAEQLMSQAQALYREDQAAYDRAKAEGRNYEPAPADDPLETALGKIQQAIDITPLDPYPHYVRGTLALHYDDKQDIAHHDFSIQRRLDPSRVNVAIEQARAWSQQDPKQVLSLWREAMERAKAEESRFPNSPSNITKTYQRALETAAGNEGLAEAALELADGNPESSLLWAKHVPVKLVDREMPRMLLSPAINNAREMLFETWKKRGSGKVAAEFSQAHPELALPRD